MTETNEPSEQKPQEVEAKWTYEVAGEYPNGVNACRILKPDGSWLDSFTTTEPIAKDITDRFNELARLKSYQGKVPSDEDIDTKYPPQKGKHWVRTLREAKVESAKWMRSEVSPYIQRLEEELKQAKEALSEADVFVPDYKPLSEKIKSILFKQQTGK